MKRKYVPYYRMMFAVLMFYVRIWLWGDPR